jgi:hypothetical protein
MMLFLCKPALAPPPHRHVTAQECRVVMARPTEKDGVYEVEIQNAPPINIEIPNVGLEPTATRLKGVRSTD